MGTSPGSRSSGIVRGTDRDTNRGADRGTAGQTIKDISGYMKGGPVGYYSRLRSRPSVVLSFKFLLYRIKNLHKIKK